MARMKTITGETDQSGRVVHTVERDGEDVRLVMRRESDDWVRLRLDGAIPVNITREHARELAQALMDCADEAERK